jgi:hypothetical protein
VALRAPKDLQALLVLQAQLDRKEVKGLQGQQALVEILVIGVHSGPHRIRRLQPLTLHIALHSITLMLVALGLALFLIAELLLIILVFTVLLFLFSS